MVVRQLEAAPEIGREVALGVRVVFENSTACRFVDAIVLMVLFCASCCGVLLCQFSLFIDGEFDPGSGRTLAACLTHASRTVISGLLG